MPRLVQLREDEEEIRELEIARAENKKDSIEPIEPKKKRCRCVNEKCRNCCNGFLKYLRGYFRVTEIHGIRYIVDDRSTTEKIFWLVVWVACCCLAVIITLDLYNKYIFMPVVISYAMSATSLYGVPFPVVTICPETRLNIKLLNYTRASDDLLNRRVVPDYIFKRFGYSYQICNHDPEEPKLYGEMFFDEDLYDELSTWQMNYSDVFVSCRYRKEPFNCSLLSRVITSEGICFAFNNVDRKHIFRDNVMNNSFFFETYDKSIDWSLAEGFKDPNKPKTKPRRSL